MRPKAKVQREARKAVQTAGLQTDGAALAVLAEWVDARASEAGSAPREAAFQAADACILFASPDGSLDAPRARQAVASLAQSADGSCNRMSTPRVQVADCFSNPRLFWDPSRRTFHQQRACFSPLLLLESPRLGIE